jgi:hypothetical protein
MRRFEKRFMTIVFSFTERDVEDVVNAVGRVVDKYRKKA